MARKQAQPDMAFLAALLKEHQEKTGQSVVEDVDTYVKTVASVDEEVSLLKRHNAMSQTEGILLQQHYRHGVEFKKCEHCGSVFQTNYCYWKYCSPVCRETAIQQRMGLTVQQMRELKNRAAATSQWEYEPPLVLSPETVDTLEAYCRWFLANLETIRNSAKETESLLLLPDHAEEDDLTFQVQQESEAEEEILFVPPGSQTLHSPDDPNEILGSGSPQYSPSTPALEDDDDLPSFAL